MTVRTAALTRRRFLALCGAAATATALPAVLRLQAMRAYATLSFALSQADRDVLHAAANVVVPSETVFTRFNPAGKVYPAGGDAGVVDFIQNFLVGEFIFAAGAKRPPYVKLPAGVGAPAWPASGAGYMWPVKAMGWLGDAARPSRPYAWPSELARLQQLYRAGIDNLDQLAVAASGGIAKGFADPAAAPFREPILRTLHAQEAAQYDGQGEGNQPFFLTFLDHCCYACFGDPAYGGNPNYIYWEMVNFPGPSFVNGGGPSPGQGWTWKALTGPFNRDWPA